MLASLTPPGLSPKGRPLGKYLSLGFVSSVASTSQKPSADAKRALGGALGCDDCGPCMDMDRYPPQPRPSVAPAVH